LGGGKGFFLKYLRQKASLVGRKVSILLQDDAISNVMDCSTDPNRWALFAELDFLLKHVMSIQAAQCTQHDETSIVLVEGSPLTDKTCYFDSAETDPLQAELYGVWYEILKPKWRADLHVLLRSSIHSHFDRVMGNSKKEQAFVTLSYLEEKQKHFAKALQGHPRIMCEHYFEDNEPVLDVMRDNLERIVSQFAPLSGFDATVKTEPDKLTGSDRSNWRTL
jgi:hypothetical protein